MGTMILTCLTKNTDGDIEAIVTIAEQAFFKARNTLSTGQYLPTKHKLVELNNSK